MLNLSATIRENFPQKKIVIVGDLVADQFLHGTIARVSREAPVFILRHDETETLAGGAANAATGVASLGGLAVLIGVAGQDANGKVLLEKLGDSKVDCSLIVTSEKIQTTTKVRVLAGQQYAPRQQVIRIDYENQTIIDAETQSQIEKNLVAVADDADAIIISDYNYGAANESIVNLAGKLARAKSIPLLVDSRFNLKNFRGATTATPNQEEVEQILGKDFTEDDCIRLCRNLEFDSLLVTRGNKGMLLVERDKTPLRFDAVGAKEPLDVTGAGDTVIAAYALGLASGLSFADAAKLANHAGGIVVMKKGTASVTAEELLASLAQNEQASKTQTTL
ncbi:MAG: bifunctional ADP-heptose synthase [Acidobacteriota bacterium]|nr:bifunctional ADP-heptose synthase [Acidobacteriota bacterium]